MIYYKIKEQFQGVRQTEIPSWRYDMNLKEQTYICTLARCGTITKAAEELFITAPALSMF